MRLIELTKLSGEKIDVNTDNINIVGDFNFKARIADLQKEHMRMSGHDDGTTFDINKLSDHLADEHTETSQQWETAKSVVTMKKGREFFFQETRAQIQQMGNTP